MTNEILAKIEFETEIAAPIEAVWRNLIEPDRVALWLGCIRYEKRVGAVFYMQQDPAKRAADDIEGATHCEVLELSEPDRFVFSWYLPDTPKTTVAITLEAAGADRTIVHFVHDGWDQFEAKDIRSIRDALEGGWRSHVLPGLKRVAEQSAQ